MKLKSIKFLNPAECFGESLWEIEMTKCGRRGGEIVCWKGPFRGLTLSHVCVILTDFLLAHRRESVRVLWCTCLCSRKL